MDACSTPLLNEVECSNHQNTVNASLCESSKCYLKRKDDGRQECGEPDEDEDEDLDFNPFLKETLSVEASSSLSSEIEGVEANVVDSGKSTSSISVTALFSKPSNQVKDYAIAERKSGEEVSVQATVASNDTNETGTANVSVTFQTETPTFVSGPENDTVVNNGLAHGTEVINNVVGDYGTALQSTNVSMNIDEEDAICRRTRARYSLASFTLDELETFLQETDDEEDLPNVDDEAEYRKFLAAVLHGGDTDHLEEQENENIEDEDEDNDADFELEIEEALESDVDECLQSQTPEQNYKRGGRRPETRQNKRQKTSGQLKKKTSGHLNMPLRPLLPNVPVLPSTAVQGKCMMLQSAPQHQLPPYDGVWNGFTPHQIGQLHCLIHEHVQLLIQVYSLSVCDPSMENIATQIQGLLLEILNKRHQVLTWRTSPYPDSCFFSPYIRPSVPNECLPTQETSISSINASERDSCPGNVLTAAPSNIISPSDGRPKSVSNSKEDHLQVTENHMWIPLTNGHVLSVLDVAPLNIAKSYMDDISFAAEEFKRRHVADTCDTRFEKEPLFALKTLQFSSDEDQRGSQAVSQRPSSGSDQVPKKTLAGQLAEKTKQQSVAPVPKQIAKLAQSFFRMFNPGLFPHKPPPASVASRVLFTDAEDMLLAAGLMEYNTDWKAIQQRFLPCKSKHQIFVRQKNRSCSRAPENPIKAVRRLKNSPLSAEEMTRIREGLKVFKNDWISVWKFAVPYRDPSLLPRQWRIATGTQKSYKVDEQKKEIRRFKESERRRSKPTNVSKWNSSSEKEDCSAGEENNSGNDCMDNENEAYVHEAFLADWRPDTSGVSLELPTSNCGLESTRSYFSSQEYFHTKERSDNSCFGNLQCQINQQFSPSLRHSQSLASSQKTRTISTSSSHPNNPLSSMHIKSSKSRYRAHTSNSPCLVKLAPDLPLLNLPSSVRVMSQSAFKNYQRKTVGTVASSPNGFAGPSTTNTVINVSKSGAADLIKAGHNNGIPLQNRISHLHPKESVLRNIETIEDKDESEVHMHPLLFRAPENRRLPYHPLHCSTDASRAFNFFPRNQPLLNLSLFHNPKQADYPVSQSGKSSKSMEKSATSFDIDFHPLLQRSDDVNSSSVFACTATEISHPAEISVMQHAQSQESVDAGMNTVGPLSTLDIHTNPNEKTNELDLDIHLSCAFRKQSSAENSNAIDVNMNREPNARGFGIRDIQRNTNPYKHPAGSSSEVIPPLFGQNVNSVAPASFQTNQYITRDAVDNTENQQLPEIVMEQEELSDSEEENAEDVEFECEEMTDSEGEGESDCEQIHSQGIEELPILVNKVAMDGDINDHEHESGPHCEPDHIIGFSSEGSNLNLRIEDRQKDIPTSSLCLNLNSCHASQTMKPKEQAVTKNRRGSADKNKVALGLNGLSKVPNRSNKHLVSVNSTLANPTRRPRTHQRRSRNSSQVAHDESSGTIISVDSSDHVT